MILLPLSAAPWCNSPGMLARATARATCPEVGGELTYRVWGGLQRPAAARCAS